MSDSSTNSEQSLVSQRSADSLAAASTDADSVEEVIISPGAQALQASVDSAQSATDTDSASSEEDSTTAEQPTKATTTPKARYYSMMQTFQQNSGDEHPTGTLCETTQIDGETKTRVGKLAAGKWAFQEGSTSIDDTTKAELTEIANRWKKMRAAHTFAPPLATTLPFGTLGSMFGGSLFGGPMLLGGTGFFDPLFNPMLSRSLFVPMFHPMGLRALQADTVAADTASSVGASSTPMITAA